jgi:hypothetical protein
MALDESQVLTRIRRIEDYLAQVGTQIGVPFELPGSSDVPPEVIDLVRDGDRLRAVKLLTEIRDIGLREAKDIVDAL